MRRICIGALCMVWLLITAGASLAQAPVPSVTLPNIELYGGFVVTSPDYGPRWDSYLLHGFEGAVSKGVSEHLWVTGSFDFVWANPTIPNIDPIPDPFVPPGAPVEMHIKQISLTVGPKYYLLTGKFRPYATGQIGYARQSSDGFYAGDHHPPIQLGTRIVEQGLTYRFGGGFEWQVAPKWYWRVISWDWQPQPWARHTPWYSNLGSGVGWRF